MKALIKKFKFVPSGDNCIFKLDRQFSRVDYGLMLCSYTLQIISETIFPASHLTGAKIRDRKQNYKKLQIVHDKEWYE